MRSATRVERQWDDPLAALAWMADAVRHGPADARWVGYLSYDLGRLFESLPAAAADALPLFAFGLCQPGPPDEQVEAAPPPPPVVGPVRSTFSQAAYEAAVERALAYVRAGDVFQVNLSQRFAVPTPDRPAAVYARLPPAAYAACLDFGPFALVSQSPELFLRVTPDRRVTTRPIKGTRPSRPGLDVELRDSAKDAAELNMIVDLERNDLGRVCEIGSVRVTQPRTVEAHPTVYHAVATVEGQLRADGTFVDLLRATFPGGSVTGAPKIRAMQIIDEIEPVRRGPYCGAIGYLAADGSAEFSVAIRTITLVNGTAYVPVGGGIVAESDPAAEYEETLVKAAAMFAALGVGG